MKITTFTAALALPALAFAQSDVPFAVIAARSASPIHLQSVNANGLKFWIGKPTSSFCPDEPSINCTDFQTNATFFAGGNVTLGMDTEVPGGQGAYIASDGSLSFTEAHSGFVPPGSLQLNFTKEEGPSFGVLGWTGGDFVACPSANGSAPYQVFAPIAGFNLTGCLGFDALTSNVTGKGAWQYE